MPKKFHGENSKAVVARARKEAVRLAENEKKEKQVEDAYWAEDDKNVLKKQQRKDEKEKKKQEVLEKKAQLKAMEEEEMNSIKGAKSVVPTKTTRAEIVAAQELELLKAKVKTKEAVEIPIEENINRLEIEGDQARTVEEAISILSDGKVDEIDRHPEKRVKAAYLLYEEINLPLLKAENPNMRLSQLKQMLKKDWMKSPENPLNQRHIAYNSKP